MLMEYIIKLQMHRTKCCFHCYFLGLFLEFNNICSDCGSIMAVIAVHVIVWCQFFSVSCRIFMTFRKLHCVSDYLVMCLSR